MSVCLAKGACEDQPAKIVTSNEKEKYKSPDLQDKNSSTPKGRITYTVYGFTYSVIIPL